MAFVVTLRDIYPPIRTDVPAAPWTQMITQESADGLTGWSVIDTWVFADPDSDPTNPKPRSRTIETATQEQGFYRVRFVDQTGDLSVWSAVMQNAALPDWSPAVREVASLMRARTKDSSSNEVGTFNQQTRPTAEQVEEEIENQAGFIAAIVGFAPLDANVRTAAKNLTKLRAAMALESSFFPEQIDNGHSPYRAWQDQYKFDFNALKKIIDPDDSGGTATTDAGLPSYRFPSKNNLVGWKTRF